MAIVAEEFARGLVDVPFAGPALADALRPATTPATIAVGGVAPGARGISRALTLRDRTLETAPLGETAVSVDLTRHSAPVSGPRTPAGEISAAQAQRWPPCPAAAALRPRGY